MDLNPPATALSPFAAETATLRRSVRRGEFPEGIELKAMVRRGVPSGAIATGGEEGGASWWTVAFLVSSLPKGLRPIPGMTLDPGTDWPRLFVHRAVRLGNAWHLECSGDERGDANG